MLAGVVAVAGDLEQLAELFQKQLIDVAEARRLATNADALNVALRGISDSHTRLRPT